MLNIGGVDVENPLFLAPLAGVSISAVRRLYRRLGVGLTHSEMISSTGVIRDGKKTIRMTDYTPQEQPLALQLFAGDADSLCRSAEVCLKEHSYSAFSINMACPMPKVMKRGAGCCLLQKPSVAEDMVTQLKKFGLPVWPKIRKIIPDAKHYDRNTSNFAELLLAAGADTVAIHGRTPAQRYTGTADKEEVISIARRFSGKITASGDVYTAEDVKMYLDGGCCAVLGARGAVANPFMVVQSLSVLGYNTSLFNGEPSASERAELLITFAEDLVNIHGERTALVILKRFLSGFFKGMTGTAEFKRAIAVAKDWNTVFSILCGWRSYFERGFI
ncbi:MAG: tRNA-dihydrouridine synthase [Pyramidobacter sp.]|nr:tRNA-dihydrouridine synthase [Pyramidobacter sp.]